MDSEDFMRLNIRESSLSSSSSCIRRRHPRHRRHPADCRRLRPPDAPHRPHRPFRALAVGIMSIGTDVGVTVLLVGVGLALSSWCLQQWCLCGRARGRRQCSCELAVSCITAESLIKTAGAPNH